MITTARAWEQRIRAEGSPQKALFAQRFFRTGKGEYGEGDQFVGVPVPRIRALAREAQELDRQTLAGLLTSPWHEVRSFALIVLTHQTKKLKTDEEKHELAQWVLARRSGINNWDLVDVSIPLIFGGFVPPLGWEKTVAALIPSSHLWDRRMAMITTFGWMRQGNTEICFTFAEQLLHDREDLMQKAVGWMLREAGKRDEERLRRFLDTYAATMPRTALRYAIERFSSTDRRHYMAIKSQRV